MLNSSANFALPRALPRTLKIAVIFSQPMMLGGMIVMVFGVILSVVFATQTDFESFSFDGTQPHTRGVITSISKTNSSENKKKIFAYAFRFSANSKSYSDESFRAGATNYSTGDTIDVEYIAADPSKARIVGMRSSPFGALLLIFLIEPLIGLILLVIGWRRARKNIYLLANGLLTYGKVIGKESTGTKVNGRRVYKIHFTFNANGQSHQATVKTNRPDRVTDEKEEALVYYPANPGQAVLLDALPVKVRRFFEELGVMS